MLSWKGWSLEFPERRKFAWCNHLELWARSHRSWVAAKDPRFKPSEVGLGRGRNIRRELFLMCREHPSIRGRSCWVFFMPWVHSLLFKMGCNRFSWEACGSSSTLREARWVGWLSCPVHASRCWMIFNWTFYTPHPVFRREHYAA